MILALYKGTSFWPSRCIEFINWSPYSHAAGINEQTGECIEAWSGGVQRSPDFGTLHNKGTEVDFFKVLEADPDQKQGAWDFMEAQVGKGYDYWGVVHFITHRNANDKDKWFCSELFFEAYRRVEMALLMRIDSDKVYPGMLALSPRLGYMGTMKTGGGVALPSGKGAWT